MQLRKIEFISAGVGALVAATLSAIILAGLTPLHDVRSIYVSLGSFVVFFPFCLIGNLIIGVPVFLMLVKVELFRWWAWIPISLALGVGLAFLFGYAPDLDQLSLVAAISITFTSAFSFRLVWAILDDYWNRHQRMSNE